MTDLLIYGQRLCVSVTQAGTQLRLPYKLRRISRKFCVERAVNRRSILSGRYPPTESWTRVGVHRVLRRSIMATRRTTNLVGGCRCMVDRVSLAGTLRMLWAVRGWHIRPVHGAQMGRATKLAH